MTEGAKDRSTIPEQLEALKQKRKELSIKARESTGDTQCGRG